MKNKQKSEKGVVSMGDGGFILIFSYLFFKKISHDMQHVEMGS